jgi:hypothetical protein
LFWSEEIDVGEQDVSGAAWLKTLQTVCRNINRKFRPQLDFNNWRLITSHSQPSSAVTQVGKSFEELAAAAPRCDGQEPLAGRCLTLGTNAGMMAFSAEYMHQKEPLEDMFCL